MQNRNANDLEKDIFHWDINVFNSDRKLRNGHTFYYPCMTTLTLIYDKVRCRGRKLVNSRKAEINQSLRYAGIPLNSVVSDTCQIC